MKVNGFDFKKLDYFKRNLDAISPSYGIYQWVYWPKFDEDTILVNELIDLLKVFTVNNFHLEEELRGSYKFMAKIWEQGYKDNENMFGLSDLKDKELQAFLATRSNIVFFSSFFKEVCFARPFYLGKADNLKARLSQHINGRTNIIKEISAKKIPEKDIWVGIRDIPAPSTTNLNAILEEIYSRAVKPGLTIKPN